MPEYDDIDTGHDYDGIREYDNRLPLWWLITLWGAVAFGMIYWCWNRHYKYVALLDLI